MIIEVLPYALFALGIVAALMTGMAFSERQKTTKTAELAGEPAFLIRGGTLIESNFAGRRLLDSAPNKLGELHRLRLALSHHFTDVENVLADHDVCDISLTSQDGSLALHREVAGDAVRLRLTRLNEVDPRPDDVHRMRALRNELETLRANTMTAPFLVWRQNASGEVVWVNQSYVEMLTRRKGQQMHVDWPLEPLFPELTDIAGTDAQQKRRVSMDIPGQPEPAWFDCHIVPIDDHLLFTAFRADEAVRAETRRIEFIQTLTKTFADLSIGLAIFDKSRRLALFNPALTELTTLPVDFLSARPSLVGFLDRLRECRMMPDPKDYSIWRTAIAELEAAAANGTYSDVWSLPGGETYQVTGHPHPDGAVALLIEDISAEISLTRRFRGEQELTQSVLDSVDDAIAVFSSSGKMIVTNRAYRRLWSVSDETLRPISVTDATRTWHSACLPNPVWGDFRDFAQTSRDRVEWTASANLHDGRQLLCRFVPKAGGNTMAMFRVSTDAILAESLREVG